MQAISTDHRAHCRKTEQHQRHQMLRGDCLGPTYSLPRALGRAIAASAATGGPPINPGSGPGSRASGPQFLRVIGWGAGRSGAEGLRSSSRDLNQRTCHFPLMSTQNAHNLVGQLEYAKKQGSLYPPPPFRLHSGPPLPHATGVGSELDPSPFIKLYCSVSWGARAFPAVGLVCLST